MYAVIEEAAEFWYSVVHEVTTERREHSTGDYDDLMRDVNFDVDIQRCTFLVPIEGKLAKDITVIAEQEELALEILVNLWLREKVTEIAGNYSTAAS